MERIIIQNVGPIKKAEFSLNNVNVFIGPQSSGKSTIAKLVSFCQWLEKYIVINQGTEKIDNDFFIKKLLLFHGFDKFFKKDSYVEYESDSIFFKYHSIRSYTVELKDGFKNALMNKVAYIPSERNILSLPNISSLQMENNYVRSFLFDWLNMRRKYSSDNSYSILNLGVNYYYDETRGDIISLGDGKELSLSEASSGLQALIPMLVYVNYVTKWIYDHGTDISYDKYTSLQKALLKDILKNKNYELTIDEMLQSSDIRNSINSLLNTMSHLSKVRNQKDGFVSALIERIGKPHSTKLTIEESEMNIFPSTQYELVKAIIGAMRFERGDTLLMTTHSPYIMTSINNLIQAGNSVKVHLEEQKKVEAIIPKSCWLNYADVSAWAVEKGIIASMNDDECELISSDVLDKASDDISEDFSKLINE